MAFNPKGEIFTNYKYTAFFTTEKTFVLTSSPPPINSKKIKIKSTLFHQEHQQPNKLYKLKHEEKLVNGLLIDQFNVFITAEGKLFFSNMEHEPNCYDPIFLNKHFVDIAYPGEGGEDKVYYLLTSDGEVYSCSTFAFETNNPTKLKLPKIKKICAGNDFMLFLTEDGQVYASRNNTYGQLGLGDKKSPRQPTLVESLSDVIDIAAGYFHSLFLTKNRNVYGCGSNLRGQLGSDDKHGKQTPTLITNLPNNIAKIFAGADTSCFITRNHMLLICGDKLFFRSSMENGETKKNRNIPMIIAKNVSFVAPASHEMWLVCRNGEVSCSRCNGDQKVFCDIKFPAEPICYPLPLKLLKLLNQRKNSDVAVQTKIFSNHCHL